MGIIQQNTNQPLFSFCLFAYNQEKYIREAIEGALCQTYSPLEIVLSDDCSTDRTFNIMTEMVSNYKGPHKIILNQNETNLGVVSHVNKVVKIAHGEWLIFAAGDDVSIENRVDVISKIVNNSNVFGIGTASWIINKEGINQGVQYLTQAIRGSNSAWHRKCFKYFGDLPENLKSEDNILFFRSLLLGGVAFSSAITIKYRMFDSISHKSHVDFKSFYVHMINISRILIDSLNARITELEKFDIDLIRKEKTRIVLQKKIERITNNLEIAQRYLRLLDEPLSLKIKFLVQKNMILSLKKRLKFVLLTNPLFSKVYSILSPQWLTVNYPKNDITPTFADTMIKTLDMYIVETDLSTGW